MLANILLLVIDVAASFLTLMLLARFFMQWQRISFLATSSASSWSAPPTGSCARCAASSPGCSVSTWRACCPGLGWFRCCW